MLPPNILEAGKYNGLLSLSCEPRQVVMRFHVRAKAFEHGVGCGAMSKARSRWVPEIEELEGEHTPCLLVLFEASAD